ncbi:MAG: efflux transporter outer membrane subunit [Alphaproteobacteria bacterium]
MMTIEPRPTTHRPRAILRGAALLAAALGLGGCPVGPDFERPAPPEVARYVPETPEAPAPAPPDQRVTLGQSITADWWTLFHSSALNDTLEKAIEGNKTLAAAKSTLAQAEQAVVQARAGLYPQLDANASVQRQQTSSSQFGPASSTTGRQEAREPFTTYALGPAVKYNVDVFGGTRRQIEQQEALAEAQNYQLAAAYLTLTGNAVSQAIAIASARQQIATTEQIIADDEKNLALVNAKFEAGKAARTDILTAEAQLANDRSLLPPLRQQLSVAQHALSILVGQFPGNWAPPAFSLAELVLPGDLPVSLPSELVRQRPDILATEAQLHAASAAIGVATAQMYPSINLSASVGQQAITLGSLFTGPATVWSLLGSLTAPIFHGGALEAQRQGAVEAFQASLSTYQQTVLSAFGQVADTLRALEHDAQLVDASSRAATVAGASLELQRISYGAGKSDFIRLLDSERQYNQALLTHVRALAQRYQDTAQLFVAMGGGWWDAKDRLAERPKAGSDAP